MWPDITKYLVIRMIPKKVEGKRPIGLMDPLPMLWERTRKQEVAQWRGQLSKKYDGCLRGRRIEDTTWRHASMQKQLRTKIM